MTEAIFVFDGNCGMCNGFVAFAVRRDPSGRLRFAAAASAEAAEIARRSGIPVERFEETSALWDGQTAWTRTDGIARGLRLLPAPWRWLAAFAVFPRPWRDAFYRVVARRRRRIVAEDPTCGVPPADIARLWRERLATAGDLRALGGHRKAPPA